MGESVYEESRKETCMSLDDLIRDLPSADRMREIQAKVADVVKQLSGQATRFGEKYRMRGPVFTVGGGPREPKTWEDLLKMLTTPGHSFMIGRVGEAWDVFCCATPTIWNIRFKQDWARIQICRLEAKVVFIRNAKEIFADYFKHVADFLENAPKEITHADAVIRELQELLKPVATP